MISKASVHMSNAVEYCPIREYFLSGDREWDYGEARYRVTGPVNTYVADDDKTSEVCVEFAPIGHTF